MKRFSLALVFALCVPFWAQQKLADGLYAVLQGKPSVGSLVYRLDTEGSAVEVSRFLFTYGGALQEDLEDPDRFVVTTPNRVKVRWRVRDYAAAAGAAEWETPDRARVFPISPNPPGVDGKGVLAFWRQRNQLRSDILLFTDAVDLYRPLQHRAFAYAQDATDVSRLRYGNELWLAEVWARGEVARKYLHDYQRGLLRPADSDTLWQAWLDKNYPAVARELAGGEWVRDSYGFYVDRDETTGENDGASVEFSYSYQSLRFADLQGESSGVALVGRDRLLPVVDYFLRRIPAGGKWSVLVPPWMNHLPGNGRDDSWYRYAIAVTAVF